MPSDSPSSAASDHATPMKKPFFERHYLTIFIVVALLMFPLLRGAKQAILSNTNNVKDWLPQAWALVSANPARAAGLADRGALAPGLRADAIIVDDRQPGLPRVVATVVGGRLRYATTQLATVAA